MTSPESKWTSGPWQFYADLPSTEPNWHIVTNATRLRVLANIHIEPGNLVDTANAHLIASAPDLYDALKDLLHTSSPPFSREDGAFITAREKALAVLAKAEGRS